jgi:hypothetical protein
MGSISGVAVIQLKANGRGGQLLSHRLESNIVLTYRCSVVSVSQQTRGTR